jgi:hypothetical protein
MMRKRRNTMEDIFADLANGDTEDAQELKVGPVPSVKVTYKLLAESIANTAILINFAILRYSFILR